MNARHNLKEITVTKNQNSISIRMTIANDPRKCQDTYYIGHNEINSFLSQFDPQENQPIVGYYDGSWYIRPHAYGITIDYLDRDQTKVYVSYPGKLLKEIITTLLESITDEDMKDHTTTYCDLLNHPDLAPYAPTCKIEASEEVKKSLARLLKDPTHKDRVRRALQSIASWTRSGNRTNRKTAHIYFDTQAEQNKPYPSFYWVIMNADGTRDFNGGLIFHPNYTPTGYDWTAGEYSMHT